MDPSALDIGIKVALLVLTILNLIWGVKTWLASQETAQRQDDRKRIQHLERNKADKDHVNAVEANASRAVDRLRDDLTERLDMMLRLLQVDRR